MAEEKFNAEGVKSSVAELETAFTDFANILKDINVVINENVNVGPDKSAVFGTVGTNLLNTWNENASTFGDFKANFDNWSKLVAIIEANNLSFEEEAIATYKSNGGNLAGIQSKRDELFVKQALDIGDTGITTGELNPRDVYRYYDENGNLVNLLKDKDGNTERIFWGKDDKVAQKIFSNADGTRAVVTYDENGQAIPKYYDKDGNVLAENPGFDEREVNRPIKVDNKDAENVIDDGTTETVTEKPDLPNSNDEDAPKQVAFDDGAGENGSSSNYTIDVENTTAKDMYNDAKNLSNELSIEQDYLMGYKGNLEYAKGQLELNKGSMSNEDYEALMDEYDSRIQLCEQEIESRATLCNNLNSLTADKFGTSDGVLKDAQDFGSNDILAARQALDSVNKDASNLTSLQSIVSEKNELTGEPKIAVQVNGLRNPDFNGTDYGNYTQNLSTVANGNERAVSDLTMKSAYLAAGDNKEQVYGHDGVYLYNTSKYLTNGQELYQGGSDSILREADAFNFTSNYKGYDSVYDSNTGKYYTYSEYLEYIQNK